MKVSGVSSYRWTILLLATLVQVGVSILQQAPAALGPVLIRDLDLSRAQIGLLSSAIWGGMLLGMLPVGLLIDRHGERRLIVAGVTAMALLVLWATQLRAFVLLLILFLLASIGAASSAPGGSKAIAAWFPSSRRGGAMGIRQTGVTIGGLAAAFLLPPVAVRFRLGSRSLGLGAGVTLVTVLLFALFYRELPEVVDEGADSYPPRVPLGPIVRDRGFLATTGYAFVLMGVQGFRGLLPGPLPARGGRSLRRRSGRGVPRRLPGRRYRRQNRLGRRLRQDRPSRAGDAPRGPRRDG